MGGVEGLGKDREVGRDAEGFPPRLTMERDEERGSAAMDKAAMSQSCLLFDSGALWASSVWDLGVR